MSLQWEYTAEYSAQICVEEVGVHSALEGSSRNNRTEYRLSFVTRAAQSMFFSLLTKWNTAFLLVDPFS